MSFTVQEAVKVLGQKFLLQEGIAGISHHSRELIVYVESEEAAERVPAVLMGIPVRMVVSGKFRTLEAVPAAKTGRTLAGILASRTERWRPVPGGCSIGSVEITAGTNAGRVYDAATGRKLLLSNRHIFWGARGTPIVQPGVYDGGSDPQDRVATIERWVELRPPPDTNLVDCALGLPVSQDTVSDEVLDIGVVTSVRDAAVGMRIAKSGRSSNYAEATVQDTNATVKVSGYDFGEAVFEDQIITDYLGAPGDSGSICVEVASKAAVGLLFAGSSQMTVLNKMTNVARLLGVSFSPPAAGAPGAPPSAIPVLGFAPLMLGMILFGASSEGF
jgi:hypothetical protein